MNLSINFRGLTLALLLLATAPAALASYADQDTYAGNLFNNWGGARTKLAEKGIDVTVEYKADLWNLASGGLKSGTSYNDNLDIKFELDGEKLFGIKGNRAMVYFLNNNGSGPNRRVGSVEGIDNIEVGTNTFKLYELWDEQSFFDDRLSVLIGLHDLNSEFMVNDMTANFIHPAFQVNQEFAQTGKNGPSIFPNTSLAARVNYAPTKETYIMAAVFDGVPGNPDRPRGTHIDFESGDGALYIAELGFTPPAADQGDTVPNKFAIGAWTYSDRFDDLVTVDSAGNPIKKRSEGVYVLSSYQFYHDKNKGRDVGAFFRAGMGDGDTAQTDWFYAAGLVGNGWVPTRPDGELGLGFTESHNSDKYIQAVGAANRAESSVELYYRDAIYNGITLQPDIQYIVNPGTDPAVKNATIIGMRMDINF